MATVFISHSSKDDKLASQLENWMLQNGFSDLFIDHSAIRGGDKWADALRDAAGACRVVVLLVTQNWLASGECPSEFKAAWYMGKRILPLFLLPPVEKLPQASQDNLQRVMAETQGLSLLPLYEKELGLNFVKNEETSAQIKNALTAAGALKDVGLSPDVFEINRQTHELPFPGLRSFGDDDADAALFFGRSREISEAMEALRQMSASNKRKCLVILGASGSGKSSLLKAGIIPRLRREAPAWIVLRTFRPGADPLLNFAESFTRTLADFKENIQAKGHLKQALLTSWKNAERDDEGEFTPSGIASLQTQLDELANRLRDKTNRKTAVLFISVDQAEELARADDESGRAVADYLRIAMKKPETWRIAFTIRTDSFPELQNHPHFKDMEAQGYDLRSLPIFKFDDVVEKPADRYGVRVDHDLVEALMEDAPGRDALPLLAFAVQHLWDQFAGGENKKLTLKNYTDMGRLSGMIDTAAERALVGIEPDQNQMAMPKGGALKSQQEIGSTTFVPMLVDINEEGAAIRRVADWSEFDADQQAMLDRFDRWRLVVKKSDDTKTTVEVAHEALFREWLFLSKKIMLEKDKFESLNELKASSAKWVANKKHEEFLLHFGERLEALLELSQDSRFSALVHELDKKYIYACKNLQRENLELKDFNKLRLRLIESYSKDFLEEELRFLEGIEAKNLIPIQEELLTIQTIFNLRTILGSQNKWHPTPAVLKGKDFSEFEYGIEEYSEKILHRDRGHPLEFHFPCCGVKGEILDNGVPPSQFSINGCADTPDPKNENDYTYHSKIIAVRKQEKSVKLATIKAEIALKMARANETLVRSSSLGTLSEILNLTFIIFLFLLLIVSIIALYGEGISSFLYSLKDFVFD